MDCCFFVLEFRGWLPFLKCIWLTFWQLETHKFHECKYADAEDLFHPSPINCSPKKVESFSVQKQVFLSVTFNDWLAISSVDFSVDGSGKALGIVSFRSLCEQQEDFGTNTTNKLSHKTREALERHCPHRYELIDFRCSSLGLADSHSLCLMFLCTRRCWDKDLHENFLISYKIKNKF